MASPPASTKTSPDHKLRGRARERWPQLARVDARFRGQFAYISGRLPDGETLPLCRLRYGGHATGSSTTSVPVAGHLDLYRGHAPGIGVGTLGRRQLQAKSPVKGRGRCRWAS
jgi:hypothetical protein